MDAISHYWGLPKDWRHIKREPIKVYDKAWIGFNSIILKGVTTRKGAIAGSESVVKRGVPSWNIVTRKPAKIIREIPEHER